MSTVRLLRLLSLLESRPSWTAEELAEKLEVTTRSVRRNVERLRELGYPVEGERGAGGGYRLGAGGRMPPLLLDDDEAVAVAVCLRAAGLSSVEALAEPAMRTLTKLDRVLPPRLRAEVAALNTATVTLDGLRPTGARSDQVDPEVLMALARAVRDQVRVRLSYVDRAGVATDRHVAPYRLVTTGRRWYLFADDLDRLDWRTFRLDRIVAVAPTTFRFRPRPAPDPAEHVRRAVTSSPFACTGTMRLAASQEQVRRRLPPTIGTTREHPDGSCDLTAGADSWDSLARHMAWVALDLGVAVQAVEPPEFARELAHLGTRLSAMAEPQR